MIYHFAIDETGDFSFESKSYVCGVLVSKNEKDIKEKYKELYSSFFPNQTIPTTAEELIGTEQFHYTSLSKEQKDICKQELLPLADKVFVSTGKPLLFANNQNYWQVAITAVIQQLFTNFQFQKEDTLIIQIDYRADKVWGIADDKPEFLEYHNILLKQFEKLIQIYRTTLGISIDIAFRSDTKSFFVNLADIVCGISRKNDIPIISCACETVFSGDNPTVLYKANPIAALVIIFQEMLNHQFGNATLIQPILKSISNNEENYGQAWELFLHYLKFQIKQRHNTDNLQNVNEITSIFLLEFKAHFNKITPNLLLDIAIVFTEYFSHKGYIDIPFDEHFIKQLFHNHSETRATRKWEKWISYNLRKTQILFNAYDFGSAETVLEELWNKQEKIIDAIGFDETKDEQTTAIIGSLAQSYAYGGNLNKAIEYFEMSMDYAIKTSTQTYSYLFSCAFLQEDSDKARAYFEKQSGQKAENFNANNSDVWGLLSYTKLRALELYKNGKTALIDVLSKEPDTTGYPYPLLLKWQAVAFYLENKEMNKEKISRCLQKSIEELVKDKNGFALKTLALSLIQIWGLVDNANPYHSQYNSLVAELTKESPSFKNYLEKMPFIKSIKNEKDIWHRAIALPFIYS